MSSAIVVGAAGIQMLVSQGRAQPEVKPLKVGGIVAGATLFGAGLAVLGYCPGTAVAAMGEGQRDAMAGVSGMLAGAGTFVALQPKLAPVLNAGGDLGKITLPSLTSTSVWPWLAAIASSTLASAITLEAKES